MNTTAIYPNRVTDKVRIDAMGLPEFPDKPIKLYTKDGTLICNRYVRIVYGDHGPYIEMDWKEVNLSPFRFIKKSDKAWYDEWIYHEVMLYNQKKDVSMLPNPPKGKYSFRGNRKEGYADYKIGMIYVSPDVINMKGEKE